MEPRITLSSKKGTIQVSLQQEHSKTVVKKSLSKPPVQTKRKQNPSLDTKSKKPATINWRSAAFQYPTKKQRNQKKSKQEIMSVVFSILGAVIVGLILGASLLSIFFNNEPTYSQNSIDSHLLSTKQINQKTGQAPFHVYLLQAGNFQRQSGAQNKIRDYRKQGLAAVLSANPPYRIYLGVSLEPAGAQKLASQFQQKGIRVYIRKLTIQPTTQHKELKTMVEQSRNIFTELSKSSLDQLLTAEEQAKRFSFTSQVTEDYRQILAFAQNLKQRLPDQEEESMMTMIQSLDQAVQSAKEAKIHPNPALMWQIQEGLVRYITTYEQLQLLK